MSLRNVVSFLAVGVIAAGIASGNARGAIVILNASVGGAALTGPNIAYQNFDGVPLGSAGASLANGLTLSFTGNGAAVTGTSGIAAPPFLSGSNANNFGNVPTTGADATTYITTGSTANTPPGSAILSFAGAQTYLGILWGSVDTFNTLTFFNGATVVGTITGADIAALGFDANGNQGVNGTVYVNILATGPTTFDRVVAASTSNSFEFDNVAYRAVPEPSSVVLSLGLLGAIGIAARRFRKANPAV